MIGETFLPYTCIGEALERINQNTILKQLNNDDIFDIELQHQEDDILEMHSRIAPILKNIPGYHTLVS
jgi:hypothetical protein